MNKFIAGFLLFTLTFSAQATALIRDITLFNSENPSQIWVSWPTFHWVLGVSDKPDGPLLNLPDLSIPQGNYWLFADPAGLGAHPQLDVTLSDGSTMSAIFEVAGSNGTAQSWTRLSGDSLLSLGWAEGSIDLVGTGLGSNGINDFYMHASIGLVPEPSQYAMLLLGIGAIGTVIRRHKNFS